MKINNKHYKARFNLLKSISSDTYELSFLMPQDFKFQAGQYVWIEVNGIRKAFSISSAPNNNNIIEIIFRNSDSKFKKFALLLTDDQEVDIIGPFGSSFVLSNEDETDLIMVGGGVGIAPFLSIFKQLRSTSNLKSNVNLISINSNLNKVFYRDKLKEMGAVEVIGDYDESVFSKFANGNAKWLVSGPQGFVDKVYNCLLELNVKRANIQFEQFYPSSENSNSLVSKLTKRELPKDVFEIAVEGSSRHVVITDTNGFILYANSAAQKITGFTFEDMKGNTPRLWGGLMSPDFYKDLWKQKLTTGSFDGEITNRRKNGEIYVAFAHIDPIKDENGQLMGFVASEEDITEIKNTEENLIRRQKEMEKLNRFMINRELKMIELKKKIYEQNK